MTFLVGLLLQSKSNPHLDVSDYEYELEDGTVTLITYIGAGGNVDVPTIQK